MKKLFFVIFALFFISLVYTNVHAQSEDIMYFCEQYTKKGEVGISDRFTTGKLTVMVKLIKPIYYQKVTIQLDKYNCKAGKFEYFSKDEYDVDSKWTYIHFDEIEFDTPGFFRVFLLDPNGNTIVSNLIEIINR